jgi:hypothetical protein
VRTYDATPRARSHADRPSRPAAVSRDALRRRRANVLFVLALTVGCTIFLAATTRTQAMVWVSVAAIFALLGYVCLLGQLRQRDLERAAFVAARGPAPMPSRQPVEREAPMYAAEPRRHSPRSGQVRQVGRQQPVRRPTTIDRWSHAV